LKAAGTALASGAFPKPTENLRSEQATGCAIDAQFAIPYERIRMQRGLATAALFNDGLWLDRTRNQVNSRQHSCPALADGMAGKGSRTSLSGMSAMKKVLVTALLLACCWLGAQVRGNAADASPFRDLPGRWVGEGRIGLKDGKTETVKCRATYFLSDSSDELRQNIRCASASGKIEVKSVVAHQAGRLSGTWNELIYNLGGALVGEVTPRGFRISVRGSGLTANMEVIVREGRQIVEIQFFDSALIGLTLILQKG
jgi:hypothetical protein